MKPRNGITSKTKGVVNHDILKKLREERKMADKRMFSLKIVDSDLFLDMPLSSQCLYFHLSMRADDDGFVNNPKKIIKIIGANEDDLKILIAKGFVIIFEQGIMSLPIGKSTTLSVKTDINRPYMKMRCRAYPKLKTECISKRLVVIWLQGG